MFLKEGGKRSESPGGACDAGGPGGAEGSGGASGAGGAAVARTGKHLNRRMCMYTVHID